MSDSVQPHRRQPTRLHHPWDSPGKNTGAGCHFLLQCMKVKSESEAAQSSPTCSDPMDCSPPGSSVYGIFQARVLESGAIAFSVSECAYTQTNGRNRNTGMSLSWLDRILFFLEVILKCQYLIGESSWCINYLSPVASLGKNYIGPPGPVPDLEQQFPNLKDALKISFKKGFTESLKTATSPF